LLVIIVLHSGGSVKVLLKEGEEKGVGVVLAGGVALVRAVDVGVDVAIMCERHLWGLSAEQLDKELDNYHSGAMHVD
jgi:hypothetical protein